MFSLALATLVPALLAAFLGALVEATEAFTVVLAVGVARGWRPAVGGAIGGGLLLAAITAVLGPALQLAPLGLLQFVIGSLLVLFGLRWLRKAILRAAGHLPLHDERVAYAHQTAALIRTARQPRPAWQGGLIAAGAVLLEGLEIVFIVVATGSGHGLLLHAAAAAALATLLVLVLGIVASRPLTRIPENALKLVVGVLLTAFGIFWVGEGLGVPWPGGEFSLLGIVMVFAALAAWAVSWLRPSRRAQLRVVK